MIYCWKSCDCQITFSVGSTVEPANSNSVYSILVLRAVIPEPWSFWSAPRISDSGGDRQNKFFDWLLKQWTNKRQEKNRYQPEVVISWCWLKGSWTLGTRMSLIKLPAISKSNPFPLPLFFSHLLSANSNPCYNKLFLVSLGSLS